MDTKCSNARAPLTILMINQDWFRRQFEKLGHHVITAGWAHSEYDLCFDRGTSVSVLVDRCSEVVVPDRIIYYDDSYTTGLVGWEKNFIPSLFCSIDSHHHYGWHSAFAAGFNRVLVSQKDYLHYFIEFSGKNKHAFWLPLWATQDIEPESEKTIDVCFRGTLNPKLHPLRAKFFQELMNYINVNCEYAPYEHSYPKSKIVINQNVKGDLNFRVFEAMRCGAMLVTPEIGNGFLEIFQPGRDLVVYNPGDARELADKIKYYLANEEERIVIANNGYQLVKNKHSLNARANEILEHLYELDKYSPPKRFAGCAVAYNVAAINKYVETITGGAPEMCPMVSLYSMHTASCVLQSIDSDENCEETLINMAMVCLALLGQFGDFNTATYLSKTMFRVSPSSIIFALYYLRGLLRDGEHEEAHSVASMISDTPEQLLNNACEIVEKYQQNLLKSLIANTLAAFDSTQDAEVKGDEM